MHFDLRTFSSAYDFVLEFMSMTSDEYNNEYSINCEDDFEMFFNRNIECIKSVDISDLKVMAFHITSSIDDCQEIRTNGLINLQEVLSTQTNFKRALDEEGISFDISSRTISCDGKKYNIDYKKYRSSHSLTRIEEKLSKIARRVYSYFCINGFMVNDDVFNYGTDIHERPEFLMTLGNLFPQAKKVERTWRSKAKSYRIDFFTTVDQVHKYNFELDETRNSPYEGCIYLDYEMRLKKWMLSHAIDRAQDNLRETFLYIKEHVTIPPDQIVSISKLENCDFVDYI